MKTAIRAFVALGTLAALLGGCGMDPGTTSKKRTGVPTVRPQPGSYIGDPGMTAPAAPTAPAADDAQARALIQKTIGYVQGTPAYKLEMAWMQKQGGTAAKGVYDITGKTPRTTRIEIKEGKGKGTKVLYTGGTTAKVRPEGLLGAITVDLKVSDERLLSVRGYTIPQTDMKALMDQLGDPAQKARLLSVAPDRAAIEVAGGPLLKGCVKMVVQVDPTSGKPLMIEQADDKEVVFRLDIRNFRVAKNANIEI